jgi:hypothetical protein
MAVTRTQSPLAPREDTRLASVGHISNRQKIVHFCSPNYNDAVLQSLFSSHVGVRKRSRVIGKWKSDSKRVILSSVVLAHIQVGRQRTNGHIVAISHAEPNTHSLCLGVGLNECDLANCRKFT